MSVLRPLLVGLVCLAVVDGAGDEQKEQDQGYIEGPYSPPEGKKVENEVDPTQPEAAQEEPYPQGGDGDMSFVNPFFAGFGGRFHGNFPFGSFAQTYPSSQQTPQTPYPYCQNEGQLLPHPSDRCHYLVCDMANRTLTNSGHYRSNKLYYAVERPCAPGTAVPSTFLGIVSIYDRKIVSPVWRKAFHRNNICSQITNDCTL